MAVWSTPNLRLWNRFAHLSPRNDVLALQEGDQQSCFFRRIPVSIHLCFPTKPADILSTIVPEPSTMTSPTPGELVRSGESFRTLLNRTYTDITISPSFPHDQPKDYLATMARLGIPENKLFPATCFKVREQDFPRTGSWYCVACKTIGTSQFVLHPCVQGKVMVAFVTEPTPTYGIPPTQSKGLTSIVNALRAFKQGSSADADRMWRLMTLVRPCSLYVFVVEYTG
jgi:hypothetical protein